MIRMFKQEWPMRNTDPTVDTGSPTNAVITSALNQSARLAWKEVSATMAPRNATQQSITYPVSTDFIEIPEPLRHAKFISVSTRPSGTTQQARTLRPVRVESFVNNSYDGFPENYCVTGTKLWLRPRPSTVQEVIVVYVDRAQDLVSLDDELQFIPIEHHDFIVIQAVLLRKRIVGDDVTGLEQTVANMRSLFIMDLEQQQNENPVVSDDNLGDYYE